MIAEAAALSRVVAGLDSTDLSRTSPCPPWTIGALICHVLIAAGRIAQALAEPDEVTLLEHLARAVCDALGALSCVVTTPRRSSGAAQPAAPVGGPQHAGPAERPARDGRVLVGHEASGSVSITATLPQVPSDGVAELLDLIAAVAAARLSVPA